MLSAVQNTFYEYLNTSYKEHKETFVSALTWFFFLLFNSPHARNPPPVSSLMQDSVPPPFLKLGQEPRQRLLFWSKSKKIPSWGTKTEAWTLFAAFSPCATFSVTSADVADHAASTKKVLTCRGTAWKLVTHSSEMKLSRQLPAKGQLSQITVIPPPTYRLFSAPWCCPVEICCLGLCGYWFHPNISYNI